ncbi:signal transduction protein, putative [Heliomicrobium modesticaldum Ice1]|uniref:Signal transduction protein, putative n=1 Tax=Heliobacterium modesticaldum (strain ATCC 51547 / Ice1) TaxID=498761 RepID=B0TGE2_HELMI|nr:EAL domain-containing protein [Heliomicrobium modesticaldum]ABZ84638.1 signal transduction protein, putative [Heliomicrobium modesticaldum Ice1]
MGPFDMLEGWLKSLGQPFSQEVSFYPSTVSSAEVLKQIERGLENENGVGLVFLDIVGFTAIERSYGFSVCKQVLSTLSQAIMEAKPILGAGRGLFVHNLNGDDFAVYYSLPPGDIDTVLDFLERLAEDLRSQSLAVVNETLSGLLREPLDLHLGWAILRPTSGLSLESLVYNALKEATAIAKGHSDAKWSRRIWELKEAMAEDRFHVVYQPLLSLEKGEIIGYEALCRGPVDSYFASPSVLFPLAEKADLLYPLERQIREKAIAECGELLRDQLLFLNISPSVVKDPEFAQGNTRRLIAEHGLRPHNIVFEITERTAIDDFGSFRKTLKHYREQGFRVAVDDAGAGYSSLQAIAELQPDFIKIDMSLVRDIDTSSIKQALMETFVTFGRKIGAKIVAEGIETEKELRFLSQIGVDIGQGFFIGRPLPKREGPSAEAIAVLADKKNRLRAEPLHAVTVGSLVEECHGLQKDQLTREAMRHFQRHADCNSLVILDGEMPVGLVMRDKMYSHLANQYGVALYADRPVSLVMDHDPLIVDSATRLEKVSQMATSRQLQRLYDHIIVTDKNRCTGVVSVRTLLDHMTRIQMEYALAANPLTGLPGNPRIEQDILRRFEWNQAFTVIYIDLDNFKAFNDRYGFERGDQAIKLLAGIAGDVVRAKGRTDDLLAHIGGDDFIILTGNPYEAICEGIIAAFDREIVELYSAEDRERRCICSKDRQGNTCFFPIMSVSLAVVECWPGRFDHPMELGEVAAEVKKEAKRQSGSVYIIDEKSRRQKDSLTES